MVYPRHLFGNLKETIKTQSDMSMLSAKKMTRSSADAAKMMSKLIAKNFGGKLVKDQRVVDKIKNLVKSAKASMDVNYFVSCALIKNKDGTYSFAIANYMINKPYIAVFDIHSDYTSVEEFLNTEINSVDLVLLPLDVL